MKLSEIAAQLTELKATVAGWVKDKASATMEAISGFQSKLSALETGAVAELSAVQSSLTAEQGKVSALTTEKSDLTANLATAQGKVTALETEKSDLTGKLTEATNATAAKQTAIDAANGKLVTFLTSLKQVPAADATLIQNVEATTKAVTTTLASQGIKIEDIAAAEISSGGEAAKGGILEQYAAITDVKEKAKFYQANSKAIDAAWYAGLTRK